MPAFLAGIPFQDDAQAAPWAAPAIPAADFWLSGANTYAFSQEISTSQALTPAAVDGNPIGQAVSVSPVASYLSMVSPTVRPTLGSGGGRNSYLVFGAGAQASNLLAVNSKRTFDPLYQTGVYTILLWLRSDLDGQANQYLLEGNNATSANVGFYLLKDAANKLEFFLNKASGTIVNATTTATLLVSDGWVPIIIQLTGSGAGKCSIQIGDKAADTFTVTGANFAAATAHMFNDLSIGRLTASGTAYFRGALGDAYFINGTVSAADIAQWKTWNPVRSNANPSRLLSGDGSSPAHWLGGHTWFDANQTAFAWTDLAKSIPVASDGDAALVIGNAFGDRFSRNAIGADSAHSLLYKTNLQNSKAGFYGDGATAGGAERTNTFENAQLWPSPRCFTQFLVVKNLDVLNGSHFLWASGNSYVVVTYKGYGGAIFPGEAEAVIHMANSDSIASFHVADTGAAHILEIVRNGMTVSFLVDGKNLGSGQTSSLWQPSLMGKDSSRPEWDLFGYEHEVATYLFDLSPAQRSLLRLGLAAKWGIAGVSA